MSRNEPLAPATNGVRRPLLVVAGVISVGAILAAIPAEAAAALTVEAHTAQCWFSWQDTDPGTGTADGIVEPDAGASHRCELSLSDSSGTVIADVTVQNGPAVVYFRTAETYTFTLRDLDSNSLVTGSVAITGAPRLPADGAVVTTAGGCTWSLENRSLPGRANSYDGAWLVTTAGTSTPCSSSVSVTGQRYTATAPTDLTQLALFYPATTVASPGASSAAASPEPTATATPTTVPTTGPTATIAASKTVVTYQTPARALGSSVACVGVILAGAALTVTALRRPRKRR